MSTAAHGIQGTTTALVAERRAVLARRIRWLVRTAIAYNAVEALVAVLAGAASGSVALIGFGLDSVVEVLSAAAIAWQFAVVDHERREKTALRVVAFSFFALAAYLAATSGLKLLGSREPVESVPGIVLTALSLAVMPFLSYAQRRAGRELGSRSAVADSHQALLCTYLSAVVLAGLVVEVLFGWTWADPLAALVIAAVAVREGIGALRGEACCPVPGAFEEEHGAVDDCCAAPDAAQEASPPSAPLTVAAPPARMGLPLAGPAPHAAEAACCEGCAPTNQSTESKEVHG
jgi:Co/Zn/Cd efflux system component